MYPGTRRLDSLFAFPLLLYMYVRAGMLYTQKRTCNLHVCQLKLKQWHEQRDENINFKTS